MKSEHKGLDNAQLKIAQHSAVMAAALGGKLAAYTLLSGKELARVLEEIDLEMKVRLMRLEQEALGGKP